MQWAAAKEAALRTLVFFILRFFMYGTYTYGQGSAALFTVTFHVPFIWQSMKKTSVHGTYTLYGTYTYGQGSAAFSVFGLTTYVRVLKKKSAA